MLVGREAELDRIEALLDAARSGRGGALIVRGEPGIGKTALLAAGAERAGEMLTARASGVESEARLPFAALSELCAPMLDRLGDLPEPQAAAISAALALAPSEGVVNERLAMFAGFLGLIRAAARGRPLLILVDDAHWLDRPSAECLGYAARRLDDIGAALLIAARPGDGTGLIGDGADAIVLRGLPRADALEVLAEADLAPAAAESMLELALGNPLALRELPSLLSEEQRRGAAPIDPASTPGGALGEALGRRVASAGPEAAALLLVAAASGDRPLEPVIAACRDLGIADQALERCEAAGLLDTHAGSFTLAHPLLRSVIYGGASPGERRRAHRALAEHTLADSRAWHLAAATIGPDDELAAELDRAAERAAGRGAHEAAADAMERGAQASSGLPARSGRLYAAGLAAAMGGAYERSAALLEAASEIDDPAMRALSRHLLAMVTLNGGIRNGLDNHRMLTTEAERIEPIDPAMAALLHADAGVTATVVGLCDLVLGSGERAVAVLPPDAPPSIRCQTHAIHGMGLALKGRTAEAAAALDRADELLGEVEPVSAAAQSISFACMARFCTGQERALREQTRGLAASARQSRSLGILPWFQLQTADAAYRLGDWEEAESAIEDAIANAEVSGQRGPLAIAMVIRGRIHAARGRERAARDDARSGVEIAEPVAYGSVRIWSVACLGFLELGLGHPEEAIAELEQARALAEMAGLRDPVLVPWAPDLVEAYTRGGRAEDAAQLAATLGDQADRSEAPIAAALAARCRGLIAAEGFEQEFERALALHRETGLPLEQARTLLAYGSRLHRARRRVEARKRLREALEIFERLGSPLWSDQARAELRAAGAVDRARYGDPEELTAQEVRVARAVARGGTNREVAAELFLSPKTIDFHLGRVYRKLDIHSRAELATLVAEGRLDQAEV